jgi:hypothetical protein
MRLGLSYSKKLAMAETLLKITNCTNINKITQDESWGLKKQINRRQVDEKR